MKKSLIILSSLAMIWSMTSCSVSAPIQVTDNPVGTKVGEASYKQILMFRPMDADIGIAAAAKNGKITKVATVDTKVKSGLFVTTYTTIVTGE